MVERFTPRRPELDISEGSAALSGGAPSASGSGKARERAPSDVRAPAGMGRTTEADGDGKVRELLASLSCTAGLDSTFSIDGFVWQEARTSDGATATKGRGEKPKRRRAASCEVGLQQWACLQMPDESNWQKARATGREATSKRGGRTEHPLSGFDFSTSHSVPCVCGGLIPLGQGAESLSIVLGARSIVFARGARTAGRRGVCSPFGMSMAPGALVRSSAVLLGSGRRVPVVSADDSSSRRSDGSIAPSGLGAGGRCSPRVHLDRSGERLRVTLGSILPPLSRASSWEPVCAGCAASV